MAQGTSGRLRRRRRIFRRIAGRDARELRSRPGCFRYVVVFPHNVRVFGHRRAVYAPRLAVPVPQEKDPSLSGAKQKVDHGLRHHLRHRGGLRCGLDLWARTLLAALHGLCRSHDWGSSLHRGMFFLLEAIFLGIYLFRRELLSPWVHWASLIPLFIGGFASMIVVILANSWMHTPVGFTLNEAGEVIDVDVLAAMFSPAWYAMTSHMSVAAFEAVGFGFAAVYAFGMLRGRRDEYHKKGFFLGMVIVTLTAPVMIFSGDHTARRLAVHEPQKL